MNCVFKSPGIMNGWPKLQLWYVSEWCKPSCSINVCQLPSYQLQRTCSPHQPESLLCIWKSPFLCVFIVTLTDLLSKCISKPSHESFTVSVKSRLAAHITLFQGSPELSHNLHVYVHVTTPGTHQTKQFLIECQKMQRKSNVKRRKSDWFIGITAGSMNF